MPKYSNRDFWIGFWVSSSIFRPQQVSKLIQTQNEPVFRPPGSQNQRHRVKMWSPKAVLSISACVKTCLLVLYRILWSNSASALRKKSPFVNSSICGVKLGTGSSSVFCKEICDPDQDLVSTYTLYHSRVGSGFAGK